MPKFSDDQKVIGFVAIAVIWFGLGLPLFYSEVRATAAGPFGAGGRLRVPAPSRLLLACCYRPRAPRRASLCREPFGRPRPAPLPGLNCVSELGICPSFVRLCPQSSAGAPTPHRAPVRFGRCAL
jgi:hypothetical protein